jgi:hypothetical protein
MFRIIYSTHTICWVMYQYRKLPPRKASNDPNNVWFGAVFVNRFLVISFVREVDEKRHYEWPWSVAGCMEEEVRFTEATDSMLEPSNSVTWSSRRQLRSRYHQCVNIPPPDYSKVPPKVDCWRRKPRIGGNRKKVSCVMTRSIVQMRRRNPPGIG